MSDQAHSEKDDTATSLLEYTNPPNAHEHMNLGRIACDSSQVHVFMGISKLNW